MSWCDARTLRAAAMLGLVASFGACGFHLRGPQDAALPTALSHLRVTIGKGKLGDDAMSGQLRGALEAGAGAQIVEDPSVPLLEVYGERSERNVLSIDGNGNASGYVLRYEVSFRLVGADGGVMIEPQTVRVLRDYNFTAVETLAKEREEQELRQLMQRDAVRQIVRRLSRFAPGGGAKN